MIGLKKQLTVIILQVHTFLVVFMNSILSITNIKIINKPKIYTLDLYNLNLLIAL